MKRITSSICLMLLFIAGLNAELRNVNPDPNGDPWIVGGVVWNDSEEEWYNSLPDFVPSPNSKPEDLPEAVNNSENPYFRTIFLQQGGCCAQASTIGYTFTYEINRLLGRHVLDSFGQNIEANEFPTHFTYNYWNKGSSANGSFISNAVSTSREFGVPDCLVWREVTREASDRYSIPPRWEDPMGGNFIQWMTGYGRYENAMKNRTVSAQSLSVSGIEENLTKLKQFLFDHGADDAATGGGLAVFTMNFTNIEYGVYPAGSPEENKPFIKDTHGDIDHAMTIVGYNDAVEFDYDGINGCTNHLDTNGDGQVTMADWEKGALIIANSHGESWPSVLFEIK